MAFDCPLCPYSAESISRLHVHCVHAHQRLFFTCPWCTIPFGSLRKLQNHAKNCANLNVQDPREGDIDAFLVYDNKCFKCECRFVSAEAAVAHYKEVHLNFSYICEVCEKYFQNYANFDVHYASEHQPAEMPNPPMTPIIRRSADNPIFNERNRTPAVDKVKKKVSFQKTTRAFKRQAMKAIQLNYCTVCESCFGSAAQIIGHFQSEHKTMVFVCNEVDCGNAYMTKAGLASHRELKHIAEDNAMPPNGNAQAAEMPNETNNAANQQGISCPMCNFQTPSAVLFAAHLMEHQNVKQEPGDEMGFPSFSMNRHMIKLERARVNSSRPKPEITCIVDLTMDDD